MFHDLFGISWSRSKTSHWIFVQQFSANVSRIFTQKWKIEFRFAVLDISEQLFFGFAVKWRLATKHFIDDAAKGPPVRSFAMAFIEQNLGSQVFCSATNALGIAVALNVLLRKTKVRNFDISVSSN